LLRSFGRGWNWKKSNFSSRWSPIRQISRRVFRLPLFDGGDSVIFCLCRAFLQLALQASSTQNAVRKWPGPLNSPPIVCRRIDGLIPYALSHMPHAISRTAHHASPTPQTLSQSVLQAALFFFIKFAPLIIDELQQNTVHFIGMNKRKLAVSERTGSADKRVVLLFELLYGFAGIVDV